MDHNLARAISNAITAKESIIYGNRFLLVSSKDLSEMDGLSFEEWNEVKKALDSVEVVTDNTRTTVKLLGNRISELLELNKRKFRQNDVVRYKGQVGVVDDVSLVPKGYNYIPVGMENGSCVMAIPGDLELVERKS